MKSLYLSLFVGILVLGYLLPEPSVERPPGVLVPEDPRQDTAGRRDPWAFKGYKLTPLASFDIRARVIFKEPYWSGREADLSPLDLTVGWGLMSDQTVIRQLRLSRARRSFWWMPQTSFTRDNIKEIIRHSANIHLIPATDPLARDLKALRPGHIVTMGGTLVEATGADGWKWRSSLTRDDVGDGACELMWVEWMRFE